MARLLLLLAAACVLALCTQPVIAQEEDPVVVEEELGSETPVQRPDFNEDGDDDDDLENPDVVTEESRKGVAARTASKHRALVRTVAHARADKARTAGKARTAAKKAGRVAVKGARAQHH